MKRQLHIYKIQIRNTISEQEDVWGLYFKGEQEMICENLLMLISSVLEFFFYTKYFRVLIFQSALMQRLRRNKALFRYSQGVELYHYQLLQEAQAEFEEAIRLFPRFSKFWETLAMVQIENYDYQAALQSLKRLSRFKGVNRDYMNILRGDNYMRLGQYRKSLKCYNNVTLKNRKFSGVKVRKIRCLMAMGSYQQALKISSGYANNFERHDVSQFVRSYEQIQFLRGICYFYLENYKQAVKCLNRSAANIAFRKNTELLFYKGSSHYNIGEFQKTIICFEQLIALGNYDQPSVEMLLESAKRQSNKPKIQQAQQKEREPQSQNLDQNLSIQSSQIEQENAYVPLYLQKNGRNLQRGKRQL